MSEIWPLVSPSLICLFVFVFCLIQIMLQLVSTLSLGWTLPYLHTYCFLFPLLIQMTQIWTISVEPPEWLQMIYCPEEVLCGCGIPAPRETSCSNCSIFSIVLSYYSCGSYHVNVELLQYFWKGATCLYKLELVRVNICVWTARSKVTLKWHSPLYHPDDL